MVNEDKNKKQVEWYDNPNIITSFIIVLIALIVILSQSFAINNNLSISNILGSILNHNIGYLLVCIYFVALKTNIGKKYFDFLNIFLIILHTLTAITSLLTVFQSFGLGSLLGFAIDLLIIIFLIHTFLRSTRIWKSMNLNKSPFNEISNNGYFYSILVLAITLLAVNLISTTSFDGTILTLMDTGYTILFIRYVFLYGEFLNSKNISVKNEGNFNVYREAIKDNVNNFVEEHKLDEKYESIKDGLAEFAGDIKEKVLDIKEEVTEKIEDMELDEKIDAVKENVTEAIENIKEKADNLKNDVAEKIEDMELEKKIDGVKENVTETVDNIKEKIKDVKLDKKAEVVKDKAVEIVEDIKDNYEKVTKTSKSKKIQTVSKKGTGSEKKSVSKRTTKNSSKKESK